MTRAGRAVGIVVAAAALSACDDGAPPQRGFGSRQLAQLRDPTFSFIGSRGDVVLYSVGTSTKSYLSVDVLTGETGAHDAMYSDVPYPGYGTSLDPAARYRCTYEADHDGGSNFLIDDAQTGQRTIVAKGGIATRCPTDADPTLKIWRTEPDGRWTLWSGRYDSLQEQPIDLAVAWLIQAFTADNTAINVVGGRHDAPDALGIYSIDLTTLAVAELVPPSASGAAWADGAAPAGGTDSTSLFHDNAYWGGVVPIGDHFLYWRQMADGGVTLFAGPFATGGARELALYQRATDAPPPVAMAAAEGQPALSPLPLAWRWSAGGSNQIAVWDDLHRRIIACASPFTAETAGVASADRTKLAFFVEPRPFQDASGVFAPSGPLLLVDAASPGGGPAACNLQAQSGVNAAGMSPDGSSLFWLVPGTAPHASLWLAAPDGSAPRMVGDDRIEGPPNAPHFVGPSKLEIDIFADLVWIDTHDDPIVTHTIVERVRGGAIDRGRWLIIGYDASEQDGNADLGVVNRDDGTDRRLISPDVVTFFSPDVRPEYSTTIYPPLNRATDDPIHVIYLVRGRNPSPQDGLWVATINASDIP
ncbi:MAG TPA: hypothetical protein VIF57_26165 [Polyangia bacterium]